MNHGASWGPGTFFYNQPSYTQFNKSFDDPADALYQQLNEVHPVFMKPEHLKENLKLRVLLDPRTKRAVKQRIYDHSNHGYRSIEVFRSVVPSKLTKADHVDCLRVLKDLQEHHEADEADLLHWRTLEHVRTAEKLEFDKFVTEYSRTQKEAIYAPTARLVVLYKALYASQLKILLSEYPENLALNTYVGLPHAQSYKGDRGKSMQIENVRLVKRQGWIPVLKNYANDLQRLNLRLGNYIEYCIKSIYSQQSTECKSRGSCERSAHQFHISLESLLFLLTTGSYPDLPTEVPLEIADSTEHNFKIITFKEPLPSRICGWYTHKLIVEKEFEALVDTSEETQWLYVEDNDVRLHKKDDVPEIKANQQSEMDFHAYKFNDYMQNISVKREKNIKTNFAEVEWNINGKDEAKKKFELQIFTRLKMAPAKDVTGECLLSSHSIKLEYKSRFGAEIMTKYELLKEWLRIKLLSQCKGFTDYGLCNRIAVNSFSVQLEHKLILIALEKQLNEVYHIQIPQLLAGLADTLQLLVNMPTGKYFLRYNSKYPDKLLLSAPSTEITQNTVFLHTLLNVEPSDLAFMTDVPHLPISDLLCTSMHTHHRIMPCAFKPQNPNLAINQESYGKIPPKSYGTIKSDEEYVQKRLQAKLALKKKKYEESLQRTNARRNQIKAKKSKQRRKNKNQEIVKANELQKFINEF